mgnify:CR=1 FL=1
MEQEKFVEDVNQVIKLDPDKKHIIRYGSIQEMKPERWIENAKSLIDRLNEIGLDNFIVTPEDSKLEIEMKDQIEVGDTVYVLDPDCKIFASCKERRRLIKCKVTAIRKKLNKDNTVDERIVVEEVLSNKYTKYHTSFKLSSYHKSFFTDIEEAKEVLKINA